MESEIQMEVIKIWKWIQKQEVMFGYGKRKRKANFYTVCKNDLVHTGNLSEWGHKQCTGVKGKVYSDVVWDRRS